jgi:hypothetical protein
MRLVGWIRLCDWLDYSLFWLNAYKMSAARLGALSIVCVLGVEDELPRSRAGWVALGTY